jgi:hypothetical protein
MSSLVERSLVRSGSSVFFSSIMQFNKTVILKGAAYSHRFLYSQEKIADTKSICSAQLSIKSAFFVRSHNSRRRHSTVAYADVTTVQSNDLGTVAYPGSEHIIELDLILFNCFIVLFSHYLL